MPPRSWFSLVVLLAGLVGAAPAQDVPLPQGVLVNPASSALQLEVWAARPQYRPGERLELHVRLGQPAYLYLYDVTPRGEVTVLFPNAYAPDSALAAGEHAFPGGRCSLVVEGPPGVEAIQAIASLVPLEIFALAQAAPSAQRPFAALEGDPAQIVARLQALLAQAVAPEGWTSAWTQFHIVPPGAQRWRVRSTPAGARVLLDGEVVGLTPQVLDLDPPEAGGQRDYELVLVRDGYQPWAGVLRLIATARGEPTFKLLHPSQAGAASVHRLQAANVLEVHLSSSDRADTDATAPPGGGGWALPWPEAISGSLAVNLGGHPGGQSTFGVELGWGGLRAGVALADTGQAVPAFYDLGQPSFLGAEEVYNEGPETELYLKLAVAVGWGGLELELGAGVVQQTQAHVAEPAGSTAWSQVVGVLPNGYRGETLQAAGLAGLAWRAGNVLLQVGYDTHRGLVGGLGLAF